MPQQDDPNRNTLSIVKKLSVLYPNGSRRIIEVEDIETLLNGAKLYFPHEVAESREIFLGSIPLKWISHNHRLNPRIPRHQFLKQLQGDIKSLGLLTPLTCALVDRGDIEAGTYEMLVIDGRHRLEAINQLLNGITEDTDGNVDVKVISPEAPESFLYQLSLYLNRTRKALKKGEYFKHITELWQKAVEEMTTPDGPPLESAVFEFLKGTSELYDAKKDLTIGRIIGELLQTEIGDSFIAIGQGEKLYYQENIITKVITAQNFQNLITPFVSFKAYDEPEPSESRSKEIMNAIKLAEILYDTLYHPKYLSDIKYRPSETTDYKQPIPSPGAIAGKSWITAACSDMLDAIWKSEEYQQQLSDFGLAEFQAYEDFFVKLREIFKEEAIDVAIWRLEKREREEITDLEMPKSFLTQKTPIIKWLNGKFDELDV